MANPASPTEGYRTIVRIEAGRKLGEEQSLKGLRCPECRAENTLGSFYCAQCDSPLLLEAMIPVAERHETQSELGPSLVTPQSTTDADDTPAAEIVNPENVGSAKPSVSERYRIVLGDGCGVCRAASYISFTADRMPQIPVAGCHDPGGCRCSLPLRSGMLTPIRSEGVTSGFPARQAESPSVPVIYDQLSGALSRAAFDVFGTVLVSETMRRGASLGLLLVGLDPSLHSAAEPKSTVEAQLRELAGVLRRLLRTSDLIARHGTRSFALLLAGTDHTGSLRVAQRIQTSINAHPATETRLARATVSQGLAVLPDGGTDLAELLARADRFMARAIADGGDRINTHQAVGGKSDVDQSVPVRASAAQGRAPASVVLNLIEESALDVPSEWLDAALFGADEKRKCEPRQLAAYLDRFPLVPSAVDIDLMPDEVAYLSRRAQRGWDSMPASSRPAGAVLLPTQGSLTEWLRSAHQTPHLPIGAVPFWDSGSLCLTNCRLLFRKRGTVESVLLSDVRSLEYLDRGLACSIGKDGKRLLLMLPDALQVGLCVARALQDSHEMALAGSA